MVRSALPGRNIGSPLRPGAIDWIRWVVCRRAAASLSETVSPSKTIGRISAFSSLAAFSALRVVPATLSAFPASARAIAMPE
ncbi:hypothetical protein D9M72_562440 [compost metagenome]